MCFRLYNGQWHTAQLDLSALLDIERPVVPEKPQKVIFFHFVSICRFDASVPFLIGQGRRISQDLDHVPQVHPDFPQTGGML